VPTRTIELGLPCVIILRRFRRFGEAMTKQRQTTGNRLANYASRTTEKTLPARGFPVQREICKLQEALDAFNERIADLEAEGHSGRAMKC